MNYPVASLFGWSADEAKAMGAKKQIPPSCVDGGGLAPILPGFRRFVKAGGGKDYNTKVPQSVREYYMLIWRDA